MTILILKNSYLTLSSDNEELLEGIYDTLSFKDTSKAYSYYKGFDSSKVVNVRFAKFIANLELPSIKVEVGFEYFVRSVLEDYEHEIIDDRPKLQEINFEGNTLDGLELWDHQVKEIKIALAHRRGIIKAPTGSGKTESFLAILKVLPEPSLVIFNRQHAAHQTKDRAEGRGIEAGLVQGKNVLERNVTIATIQSIEKIEDITKYKNLLIDECQYASAEEYQKLMKLKHWYRIYAFSATPIHPSKFTLKTAKIIANTGPIIIEINPKPLIEKKILAKPKIIFLPVTQPEPDTLEGLRLNAIESAAIVHNKHRHDIINRMVEYHKGEKILILSKYVEQGEQISKVVGAPFIWNKVKLKDRIKIVEEFDNGNVDVLVASRILDEAIDIKNFTVLIIASAGKSFAKTIQRLGRGLRATKKKSTVTVYDFWDMSHSILESWSKSRKSDYIEFGYDDVTVIKEDVDIEVYLSLNNSK